MIHEDRTAKLRREYFKWVDYQIVDEKLAAIYKQRIEDLKPKQGAKNERTTQKN